MSLKTVYDNRYKDGYRGILSGFEIARWHALQHFIPHSLKSARTDKVLDYGAGQGLHVKLWESIFPKSELHFCDISDVSRDLFVANYHRYANSFHLVRNGMADCPTESFDVVVSVEVMEHVEDLAAYLTDINRLLMPGGYFIWTTPCANYFSIEHLYSAVTHKIIQTREGYVRWAWEDPTHLRRMRSAQVLAALKQADFLNFSLRFRAHFFSFLCTHFSFLSRWESLRDRLMCLDYILFRYLPNGASMIGIAQKPTVSKKPLSH